MAGVLARVFTKLLWSVKSSWPRVYSKCGVELRTTGFVIVMVYISELEWSIIMATQPGVQIQREYGFDIVSLKKNCVHFKCCNIKVKLSGILIISWGGVVTGNLTRQYTAESFRHAHHVKTGPNTIRFSLYRHWPDGIYYHCSLWKLGFKQPGTNVQFGGVNLPDSSV